VLEEVTFDAEASGLDMENKDFDAVQFMRQVRDKMSSEMRDMSFEEQRAYIEQHAAMIREERSLRNSSRQRFRSNKGSQS
jgi:hypothetical protein